MAMKFEEKNFYLKRIFEFCLSIGLKMIFLPD